MSPRAKILAVAMVALVVLPALLSACPLCKDALEDKTTGVPNQLGRGFYYSILLMVSAPFLVVGGLFFRIYRTRRRRPEGESGTETTPAPAPRIVPEPRGARS
jgi:hypothetical protein